MVGIMYKGTRYNVKETLSLKDMFHILVSYMTCKNKIDASFNGILKEFFPTSQVLDFNYARSAIRFLIHYLDIKGKKIMLPAYTCEIFSDILAREGVIPVFVDANLETFNMDSEKIFELMSSDIKAIITIHTYGNPSDMKSLLEIKEDYDTFLIEDAAHALGAQYRKKYIGSYGDASVFSMYKTLPNIAGGFLICNSDSINIAEKALNIEKDNFAMSDIIFLIDTIGGSTYRTFRIFENFARTLLNMSYKYRSIKHVERIKRCNDFIKHIFNYTAPFIKENIKRKNILSPYYYKKIEKIEGFKCQRIDKQSIPAFMNFPVLFFKEETGISRDAMVNALQRKGIYCEKIWYNPLVLMPSAGRICEINDYKNTIVIANSIINLPFHYSFTKKDIDYIATSIDKCLCDLAKR